VAVPPTADTTYRKGGGGRSHPETEGGGEDLPAAVGGTITLKGLHKRKKGLAHHLRSEKEKKKTNNGGEQQEKYGQKKNGALWPEKEGKISINTAPGGETGKK